METLLERPNTETQDFNRELRLYDDTTTWLAEVLDGSMRTPFEYRFDGQELYGHDGGALGPIFKRSVEEAARLGTGLEFEHRRRLIEMDEYHDMIDMMRGDKPNTMVVVSDFPPELMDAKEDIGGYNVSRRQTMLRVITKTEDGRLLMRSQSLDGSDRQALEDIYYSMGFVPAEGELLGQRMHVELDNYEQELLVDRLMGVYDRSLQARLGGEWYAGRHDARRIDTYDFVRKQDDLLRAYMHTNQGVWDNRLVYDLAAAMKARFNSPEESTFHRVPQSMTVGIVAHAMALNEMTNAGKRSAAKGEKFSGCGMSLSVDGSKTTENELSELGIGNNSTESSEDKYGSLTFECPKGHKNTRPRNQLIEKCKTCGCSVKC